MENSGAARTRQALAFEGVSKRYRGGVLALDNVSWSVEIGARTCLLGPNGAGKSTSIRLLEGALRPNTGRVHLLEAVVGEPAYLAARQRTGIVPQGPGMYSDLTTGEYLELAHDLYGRGSVAEMLGLFDLGVHRDKRLDQLSGGYQRRLALAAALLSAPDVLLLDEPTVGLDPVASHDVHTYLRDAMPGRTTLLCTHNLAEAEALCDDVVILKEGRVLLHESLAELRSRAQPQLRLRARQGASVLLTALAALGFHARAEDESSSARLHDEGNLPNIGPLQTSAVPIRSNPNTEFQTPGDLAPHKINGETRGVVVEDPAGRAPELLRALLGQGIDVYACEPVHTTLEALFLDVIGGGNPA
jgi:ABC-2 type transport system ATP-binding protein